MISTANDDGKFSVCSYGLKILEDSLFVMDIMISTSMALSFLDVLKYF
ncbi:hypothetical protein LEP1GSC048_3393 [Leptospira santarosai serovar Shermani str. 1342KT]|nr:hypothetical protein LEP1GSC048_3393 [Leptospira santarosai serovar Shermani str. 1342KT]